MGVFIVLMRERHVSFPGGARIAIVSSVPEGKGVSSSAALETAVMQVVSHAFGIPLEPRELALLCQKAENLVAGAPCRVMDQMSCVYGEKDALLALLCQPAELQSPIRVPDDITFWGMDSGERHTVGGSDYGSVRAGMFMGRHLISERPGGWTDYLADIPPSTFEREFREWLPDEMSGADFSHDIPRARIQLPGSSPHELTRFGSRPRIQSMSIIASGCSSNCSLLRRAKSAGCCSGS